MEEQNSKKQMMFGEIEDVVSRAALLRPTIVKAIGNLNPDQLETFYRTLIKAERELANSHLEFRERFVRAQECFTATFAFAPVWRFIATRIEECWKPVPGLTVKELSVVSLLFGIMLEESGNRVQKKTKRIA